MARVSDLQDKRRKVLSLTTPGQTLLNELKPRVENVEQVLTQHLSATERDALRSLIGRLLIPGES